MSKAKDKETDEKEGLTTLENLEADKKEPEKEEAPKEEDKAAKKDKEAPESENDEMPVFIPSKDLALETIDGRNYVKGNVNGEEFTVEVDKQTTVKRKYYDAVKALVK